MDKAVVLLLIAVFWQDAALAGQPKLTIPQGSLVGTTLATRGGREISAFLGIPYAAPPIGHLRFKSPQLPPPWDGERDASKEGSVCIQQFILIEKLRDTVVGKEDCLYLNVFTPKVTGNEKLPVMFFIHGGGFSGGSGAMSNYGPELLLDRDVILVAINYRLGPLGFLSTGDTVLPGNLGLKDQLAALKWVQGNIEYFGGDKNSVTIFGESAGGASVHFQLLSKQSRGLFHAGISESGTALCPWAFSSPARHRQLAGKLAQLLGCPPLPSQQFYECLMDLPAERIVGVLKDFMIWDMDPIVLFNPAMESEEVEDAVLTEDPWTLTSNIPWMTGFNKDDGALKVSSLTQGNVEEKFKQLNDNPDSILPMSLLYLHTAKDPDQVTQAVRKFYFGGADKISPEMVSEMSKMYTDNHFMKGAMESVRRHSGPVFVYQFAYNRSFSLCTDYFDNPWHPGVCHFDELMYLFPMEGHAPPLVRDDPDYVMSTKMVELWTNYAKNRIPALDDSGRLWKTNKGSTKDCLLISNDDISLHQDLFDEEDKFWQSLAYGDKPPLIQEWRTFSEEL